MRGVVQKTRLLIRSAHLGLCQGSYTTLSQCIGDNVCPVKGWPQQQTLQYTKVIMYELGPTNLCRHIFLRVQAMPREALLIYYWL